MNGPSLSAHRTYQAALDEGRLVIQRCGDCGKAIFYPRELCPHCGEAKLRWESPGGEGTVYAVTTVRRRPDAGGDRNVCLVDLDEGVRLMSRVEGVASEDVRIGQRVRSRVVQENGHGLVVFDIIAKGPV